VGCLVLLADHHVLAALALGAGLFIEHLILIGTLHSEVHARDIRVPRDQRWKAPPRARGPLTYLTTHFPRFWRLVQRIKPLERRWNRFAINGLISFVDPRPNPLSTKAPYTSWDSLTDRTWSGRHLPPVSCPGDRVPDVAKVAELFRREGDIIPCPKSTVLFGFFAQWFTDGFLRTSRRIPNTGVRETLRTDSFARRPAQEPVHP
jgi:hypothetical protein